ncbi:unnamed protein product [Bursaphelenchus okinawaensis]|uniref:non-specific serine/threonine protein kinase n=1 Tax=Bursaphelenchus okinawaensis TaxID=465554 RepID=A0A811KVB3_9BILA|nr:unnamed protein product [Bursaphelenchus okinawaensis]CAG9112840.1 unnamed protein product [Bursaphelenchus okinawaensis]
MADDDSPRLWGTPPKTTLPKKQRDVDIDLESLYDVREAIRTYSDTGYHDRRVYSKYEPNELWEDDLSLYKVKHVVGAGAFGTVLCAFNSHEKKDCALKLVRAYKRDLVEIVREIRVLATLHHPNIVPLFCACVTDDGMLVMIMPLLLPVGKIIREIRNEVQDNYHTRDVVQALPEPVVHNMMKQVCAGLTFMHNHSYVHRDLKADNFLIDLDGAVKVADFGLAKRYDPEANQGLGEIQTPVGTKTFMAPEVAEGFIVTNPIPYDITAETWAVGICTMELFFGELPYSRTKSDVLYEIYNLEKYENASHDVNWDEFYPRGEKLRRRLSKYCKEFLDLCLRIDPADRMTVAELFTNGYWMLQPSIANSKVVLELLGTHGEENIKLKYEKKTRARLDEHRRENNNPKRARAKEEDIPMCISLSVPKKGRHFKKFLLSRDLDEKKNERIVHDKLFGYVFDKIIDMYDYIAITTEAVRTYRRFLRYDESPQHVDLNSKGVCIVSYDKEMFYDEENPRLDPTLRRPTVNPRRKNQKAPKLHRGERTPKRA